MPSRDNDRNSAYLTFYKSCLFATRSLIMLRTDRFPYTYDDIVLSSREIFVDKFKDLVEKAYQLRQGKGKIEAVDLIRNITFINNFIEPLLKEEYKKDKKMIVVK